MGNESDDFKGRYGPWALIAGASVGLGAAFSSELAQRGLNLVLIARRPGPLESRSAELKDRYGISVKTISIDLAAPDMLQTIAAETNDLEIGLLVYDTAYMLIGSFLGHPVESHLRAIDVNCRGPLMLAHHFGQKMSERKRGGIILMTSLSGMQGAPWLASYGATKAFNIVLAEGLWYELKSEGVDVMACCAGAIETPNYISSKPASLGAFTPKPLAMDKVARDAVAALGRKPLVIPGGAYRFSQTLLEWFTSRKQRIKIMADSTEKMYGNRLVTLN
ncbi:SDR family NAD(P)-dependent oxidoreductase [Mycobacterium sp.]|uniref:SDR family NAD(P)-dependent oxidoreductase n=1 Tax=Mycobacterium sp. TaxID=1785 RepID=UPI003C763941